MPCGLPPCANLAANPTTGTSPAVYQAFSVSSRYDSREEIVNTGWGSRRSSDLELCHDGSTEQLIGILFPDVALTAADAPHLQDSHLVFDIDEVRE